MINMALLFLTAMIWGFAFVAQFFGAEEVGPLAMNGLRFPLGTLSLLPVALIFERGRVSREERKKTVLASLLLGSVLFAASTLQQIGIIVSGSVGISSFITGLYTVLIPIACYILFRKKTGLNVLVAAVLSVIGIFMLCVKPEEGLSFGLGELLLLIGAFFWTAHVIIVDRLGKELRPLHFSLGQFTVCSVLCVISMMIFERPDLASVGAAMPSILYAGVMSVGVAYTLQVVAQKKADPTFAAIILSTEAVFGAIGGVAFGIDSISLVGYLGCAIIFVGIVISQLDFKKFRKREAPCELKK